MKHSFFVRQYLAALERAAAAPAEAAKRERQRINGRMWEWYGGL